MGHDITCSDGRVYFALRLVVDPAGSHDFRRGLRWKEAFQPSPQRKLGGPAGCARTLNQHPIRLGLCRGIARMPSWAQMESRVPGCREHHKNIGRAVRSPEVPMKSGGSQVPPQARAECAICMSQLRLDGRYTLQRALGRKRTRLQSPMYRAGMIHASAQQSGAYRTSRERTTG